MSKQCFYRQCRLEKKISTGVLQQVSYIPEPFCVVGKILKLKENNGWSNGWEVLSAGEKRDGAVLPDPHQEIKNLRRATGDSLPKNPK
jgi:hypothetical protein